MNGISKAALCAAVSLFATQAHAARVLVVDVYAQGTGSILRYNANAPISYPYERVAFNALTTTLFYNLEGNLAPTYNANSVNLTGSITQLYTSGTIGTDGFGFSSNYPFAQKLGYNVSGSGCYYNESPSTITLGFRATDPACSTIKATYSNASSLFGFDFTGTVTGVNFREADLDGAFGTVFAVPEPATWALMLTGFGLVGYAMRRHAKVAFA